MLPAAVVWIEQALLGTAATVVAIVAVAAIGATMLSGRLNLRRGATVILGCFILFGAPAIATGILSALATGQEMPAAPQVDVARPAPVVPAPPPPARAYDPYAGATVPTSR